jgi:hypothetical protein
MRCALLALAFAACAPPATRAAEQPAGAPEDAGLRVEVDAPGRALTLANGDTATLYYQLFERRFAALVNWAPCRPDIMTCPAVAPNGRTRIPFDSIRGYGPDARDAIVYWWRLRRLPDGSARPDSVRSRIVSLGARVP